MLSVRHADAVVVWAPAKVNLFLEILAKRPDGYHDLATLMLAVSLYDTLTFTEEPSGAIRLSCDNPELSTGSDNLVCRAAELLRRRAGCSRGAAITLAKRIPMAAGLAGGSSDAAATLDGLNQLWGLGLAQPELAGLAAELGSDVAFFFATPAAWCTGRGEIVEPAAVGKPLWLVLVAPTVGLATADVYRHVIVPEAPRSGDAIRQALAAGDVAEVGRQLFNRLQAPAEQLCPAVAGLDALLAEQGPAGRLMSGSGSSLFALCRDRREAMRVVRGLRAHRGEKRALGLPGQGWTETIVRSCS